MIPEKIDYLALIRDLNKIGLTNSKIELICGFSECYLSHVMRGKVSDMAYKRAQKLYNLHYRECVGLSSLPSAGTVGQSVVS